MKRFILLSMFFFAILFSGQTKEYVFVYFKDKPGYSSFLANPLSELTQKALDRRTKLGIALDEKDVPIEMSYVEDVKTTLSLPKIKSQSKWLNGVALEVSPEEKTVLMAKPYVARIESFVKSSSMTGKMKDKQRVINKFGFTVDLFSDQNFTDRLSKFLISYNNGYAYAQNAQVNIPALHLKDYTGLGIAIAVLDSGFRLVNQGKAFAHLMENNRIKDTFNFVGAETASVYDPVAFPEAHGANVLGIMGGYLKDETNPDLKKRYFVGSAPEADYYLYATEDVSREHPEEEINFIRGLERADKMGVDIATASLGYYDFDDPRYDYTYSNMNGTSTFVARGCNIAVDKGIIVMVAQGNEGAGSWHYVISPADSPKVFSIGAVDINGNPSSFTSYGPNSNGVIKPDAVALGSETFYPNSNYTNSGIAVSFGNGTSYATPVASGGLACLLQALPKNLSRDLIKDKMRQTASLYPSTDARKGHGVLNFSSALDALQPALGTQNPSILTLRIHPNPVDDHITIVTDLKILEIHLFDAIGRHLQNLSTDKTQNVSALPKGIYYLKVKTEQGIAVEKFIKQ